MKLHTDVFWATAALMAGIPTLGAQIAARPAPAPAAVAAKAPAAPAASVMASKGVKIPLSALYSVERTFDDKLRRIGDPNTVDMLGATRGIYLEGYGAVFTSEIGLVTPPAIYPFHPEALPEDKLQLHQRKIARLPRLREAMREMMRAAATGLPAVPEDQQIVIAVRLDYRQWEDTSGLPGLITIKADRKSALAGNFSVEEQ